jgi:hypothetical protein
MVDPTSPVKNITSSTRIAKIARNIPQLYPQFLFLLLLSVLYSQEIPSRYFAHYFLSNAHNKSMTTNQTSGLFYSLFPIACFWGTPTPLFSVKL